jgi:hypothetical protein
MRCVQSACADRDIDSHVEMQMATQTATTRRHGKAKAYKPAVNLETNRSADSPDGRETTTAAFIDPPTRDEMIARAAYFRAERRGFAEGCALQDWLEAEVEVDSKLSR